MIYRRDFFVGYDWDFEFVGVFCYFVDSCILGFFYRYYWNLNNYLKNYDV